MTIKQVKAIHNFIMIFQNHWCFYIVIHMFLVTSGSSYEIPGIHCLIWLGIGFLPFVLSKLKRICKYRVIRYFMYLSVLLAVYMIPTPHIAYTFFHLIATAYYFVITELYDWSVADSSEYKPIPIVVMMIMSFVVVLIFQIIHFYEYQLSTIYILVWNVILYCVASYVNKYAKFLELHRHSVGYMPVRTILVSGIWSMLGFASILSVIALIVANMGRMEDVLGYVRTFIAFVSSKIRKLIKKFFSGVEQEQGTSESFTDGIMGNITLENVKEGYSVWDIVLLVLFGIIMLFVLYRVIRAVIAFLNNLYGVMRYEESKIQRESIAEECDVIEKLDVHRKERFFEIRTPAQKIRRRFKRKVISEEKKIMDADKRGRMELYTARECSHIIENDDMGKLYEKARYSPYECTSEDVKKMRIICKGKEMR